MYDITDEEAVQLAREVLCQYQPAALVASANEDLARVGRTAFMRAQVLLPKMQRPSLFTVLQAQGKDLSNHDLSVLADWANEGTRNTPDSNWRRAYSLLREGADLLLRRRARSSEQVASSCTTVTMDCVSGTISVEVPGVRGHE
jgi:hypothetical protein